MNVCSLVIKSIDCNTAELVSSSYFSKILLEPAKLLSFSISPASSCVNTNKHLFLFQLKKTVVIWMLLAMAKLNEIMHKTRRESIWFIQATSCVCLPLGKQKKDKKKWEKSSP